MELQRKQHSSITLKKTIKELQPPEKSEPIHGATNRWCCPPRATSITGQESIATAIHPQCDRGHMFFSLQGGLSPSVPFSEPYSFQPIANLIATVQATRTGSTEVPGNSACVPVRKPCLYVFVISVTRRQMSGMCHGVIDNTILHRG